jgi:Leucine-rich repeat (LRR) protein
MPLPVLTSVLLLITGCSLLSPEHEFPPPLPLTAGSGEHDDSVITAIMRLNGLDENRSRYAVYRRDDSRVSSLTLAGLHIDTLPPEIGDLDALEELNLSDNDLSSLPVSIVKLHLFSFWDSNGWIHPAGCPCTDSTNGLSIAGNRLCTVPDTVASWIDRQFSVPHYLATDTTQQCGVR